MWAAFSALPLTGLISVLNPMLIKVMRPAARIGKSSNDLWRLENHQNGGTIAMCHIRYISGIDDTDRCLQKQGFHIWFHQRFLHQWRQQDRSNQKKGMQPRCPAWAPVCQVLQHPAVSTGADLRGKSDDWLLWVKPPTYIYISLYTVTIYNYIHI